MVTSRSVAARQDRDRCNFLCCCPTPFIPTAPIDTETTDADLEVLLIIKSMRLNSNLLLYFARSSSCLWSLRGFPYYKRFIAEFVQRLAQLRFPSLGFTHILSSCVVGWGSAAEWKRTLTRCKSRISVLALPYF